MAGESLIRQSDGKFLLSNTTGQFRIEDPAAADCCVTGTPSCGQCQSTALPSQIIVTISGVGQALDTGCCSYCAGVPCRPTDPPNPGNPFTSKRRFISTWDFNQTFTCNRIGTTCTWQSSAISYSTEVRNGRCPFSGPCNCCTASECGLSEGVSNFSASVVAVLSVQGPNQVVRVGFGGTVPQVCGGIPTIEGVIAAVPPLTPCNAFSVQATVSTSSTIACNGGGVSSCAPGCNTASVLNCPGAGANQYNFNGATITMTAVP